MLNGLKIMILEGSDILKNNAGEWKINKNYKGAFVDSLLLDKLKEIGLKESKNETTRDVVMVNFKYGYTPKEVEGLQEQIKNNKETIAENIEQKKQLTEQRKQQTNNKEKKPYTDSINNLTADNKDLREENKQLEEKIKEFETDAEKIREILYKQGFKLDFYKQDRKTKEYKIDETIEYVFFFRSPSKSKTGSVCFINKKLHKQINEWQTMGIELPLHNAKKVEMEAYKSLTSSGIENRIHIDPATEILVVNDLDSFMECMCTKVYTKNGECKVENGLSKVKNTIWDGMALVEDELVEDYPHAGMMVLRQHFFKVAGFRTHIQKFMQNYCLENGLDYNTHTVIDRYGRDVKVSSIKMITTENAMKWEKFDVSYDYWASKVNEDNNVFGVVKTDHESKYGKYQRMSFQMINTLPIDSIQTTKLCAETIDYIEKLKFDDESFIDYLRMTANEMNANEMMIDLYKNNKDFKKSELFRKFRVKTISTYKETLRAGKLLTNADNLTICGNPYVLLLHSVGALNEYITDNVIEGYKDPTLPILDQESKEASCYTTRFNNEYLAGFRSPHNSPNNILYFKNFKHDLMSTYFNFSNNIIAVNLIETNVQDRGNGLDEDADFLYISNNDTLQKASKEAQKFYTIVNCIEKDDKTYNDTMEDMVLIDNTLAKSKYDIGLSSNLAQLAMSWYWKDTDNKELADIVCILSVLAQVAIDSSKRLFKVNVANEINRISKLPCMQVKTEDGLNAKPYFWQYIKDFKEKQPKTKINYNPKIEINEEYIKDKTEEVVEKYKNKIKKEKIENDEQKYINEKTKAKKDKNNKIKDLEKHCIEEKICPMDYIQDAIDNIEVNKDNSKYKDDIDFIQVVEGKANNKQLNKVTELVESLDNLYKEHYNKLAKGQTLDEDEWIGEQQLKTDYTLKQISKIKINVKTMQMLIANTICNDAKNKKYKRRMLNCLYKVHRDLFLSVWK